MSVLNRVFIVVGICLGAATAATAQENELESKLASHPDVASNIALLEAWLEARMAYDGQPGVSVAIVYDQDLVYAKGFGYANVATEKPMQAGSIYRIASHSKLFTSIALMRLQEAGKLDLDDPIVKHLPWFDIKDTHEGDRPITIRQLITHTSGLSREIGSAYWQNFDFPTIDEVKERVAELETIFPTENRWKYSNFALTLAGEIVATVSGQSFANYVQENIITPLGMTQTSVELPAEHEAALATGYGRRMPDGTRAVMPFVDARGMAAATGVSSTVTDMAKFISWQFRLRAGNETEILNANTLREMQRVQWVLPDWDGGWGLGFGINRYKGRDLIGHGGGYPGYITNTRIDADEKIGVVAFTNALGGPAYTVLARAFDWIAPAITKAVKGTEGKEGDPAWRKLEGSYRAQWGDSHVLTLEGKLVLIDPTASNPKEGLMTLEPAEDGTFILTSENGGRAVGEQVMFELDADGIAQRIRVGVNWSERVGY